MTTAAGLPVIDVSLPDRQQVARDLVEASVEHGFVYLRNLGLDIPVGPRGQCLPGWCEREHPPATFATPGLLNRTWR